MKFDAVAIHPCSWFVEYNKRTANLPFKYLFAGELRAVLFLPLNQHDEHTHSFILHSPVLHLYSMVTRSI